MFLALALIFPVLLLLVVLAMERVERPLDHSEHLALQLDRFLDAAELDVRPEELETFVAEGYEEALARYERRRRLSRLVRRRPRFGGARESG